MVDEDFKLGRRVFLGAVAAGGVSLALGGCAEEGEDRLELPLDPPPPLPDATPSEVFQLGVASGDPLHDRVVIWTRLAPAPLEGDGGMPDVDVPVLWEVYRDEGLSRPIRNGWAWSRADRGHSVHVDVDGLLPERHYWYRFWLEDGQESVVGRTRTFPRPDSRPERLRVAVASCQKYRDGFYTAHDHLAAMELDVVLFVGDYIYESGNESDVPGRLPIDTERVTDLAGFRTRYGGYRMDASLQAAHAAHPWIVTWDDHEVSNNYAADRLSDARADDGDPIEMRRAGYQAWYEHIPMRLPWPEAPEHLRIYRSFEYGDLASLFVLDTRQYRDAQPCDDEIGAACDEIFESGRTILGDEQREWLEAGVRASTSRWNLLIQQVLFSPILLEFGLANPDQWDGYIDDREAVLALLDEPSVEGPMVISGDVHAAAFAELYRDQFDPRSARVAFEVLTTSISSGGDGTDSLGMVARSAERLSRRMHYFDAARRGFAVCDYRRDRCTVTYHAVRTVLEPSADLYTAAEFRVERESLDFEVLVAPLPPPD